MEVSVIIPIYNCELYIKDTLDNLLNQTYKDFEIILVNDGSYDSSLDICSKYVNINRNIKIINKENGGPSSARNEGIKYAKGQYIVFFDSDDIIESNALKLLTNTVLGADMAICSYFVDLYRDGKLISSDSVEVETDEFSMIDGTFYDECVNWSKMYFLTPLWNKIFLRKIVEENNITFRDDISIGEDYLWIISYIDHIKSVKVSSEKIYHYCIRENNVTVSNRFDKKAILMQTQVSKEMVLFFEKNRCSNLDFYCLAMKNVTASFSNIYLSNNYYKKNKIFLAKDITNNIDMVTWAKKAKGGSLINFLLVYIYRNKSYRLLLLLAKCIYLTKYKFRNIQRKLLKLLN